jgi:capsular polysaccharide biosynthesis protein
MTQSAAPTSIGGALWRHHLLALTVFIVVIAGVGWWLHSAPREYTASATLTATPVTSLLESTGNIENLQATLAEVAKSDSVLQEVSARLNGQRSLATLRDEVSGAHVTGTSLIRLTVTDSDPQTASNIANTVATILPVHDPSRGLLRFAQVDLARPPGSYSSPNTKVVVPAGIGLALVLAVGLALLYDALAGRVETVDQLRASTGVETLTAVRRPRRLSALPAAKAATSSAGAFRALRAALPLADTDKPFGAVVVASASARRDVSPWLAINLAVALARTRRSVLLIDGFGAGETYPALRGDGTVGLLGVLRDDAKIEDVTVEGPVHGVTVLPSGPVAPDSPIGHLESRFQKLLTEVADRFDAVIVVARPLVESDDAKAMAIGGSVVLAVAARTMRAATLGGLVRELQSAQVKLLGSVLVR